MAKGPAWTSMRSMNCLSNRNDGLDLQHQLANRGRRRGQHVQIEAGDHAHELDGQLGEEEVRSSM